MTGDDRSHPVGTGHRDEDRVNPEGNHGGRSQLSAYAVDDMSGEQGLWEMVFSRQNLFAALERVETTRGAPGVDGLTTQELRSWLATQWVDVRSRLDAGTYKPMPVRQVPIPKPCAFTISDNQISAVGKFTSTEPVTKVMSLSRWKDIEFTVFEATLAVSFGDSGGPVFDSQQQLIGIIQGGNTKGHVNITPIYI